MVISCAVLLALTVGLAWPIWRHGHEQGMFARRSMLAGATTEESRLRRWLWAGRLARVAEVFSALVLAVLLVAFAHLFQPRHWAVLAADAALLAALSGWVARRLAGEARPEIVGLVARRWPLAIGNVLVLAVAFLVADYLLGAPDTRGQPWGTVAESAFASASSPISCAPMAVLVGALAATDALAWHAAEILIPRLPGTGLRLAAWGVFLLQAGLVAVAYTRLLLGIGTALDRRSAVSSRPFFLTAGLFVGALLLLGFWLRGADLGPAGRRLVDAVDPCGKELLRIEPFRASLAGELERERRAERELVQREVREAVDGLYAEVEKGADAYLDWYFTVIGEYQRLAAFATGRLAERMQQELEARLYAGAFAEQLAARSARLAQEQAARLNAIASRLGARIEAGAAAHPCWEGRVRPPASFERDAMRALTAAGAGAGAGVGLVVARQLAGRAGSRAAGKLVARDVFKAAASLAGRTVVKRGGSALVAAAGGGAVCGPFAAFCALAAGAATWITVDKGFIEIDELRFRDEMRRQILAAAGEEKAALAEHLVQVHGAAIDRSLAGIDAALGRVFVPARDGVRPPT